MDNILSLYTVHIVYFHPQLGKINLPLWISKILATVSQVKQVAPYFMKCDVCLSQFTVSLSLKNIYLPWWLKVILFSQWKNHHNDIRTWFTSTVNFILYLMWSQFSKLWVAERCFQGFGLHSIMITLAWWEINQLSIWAQLRNWLCLWLGSPMF